MGSRLAIGRAKLWKKEKNTEPGEGRKFFQRQEHGIVTEAENWVWANGSHSAWVEWNKEEMEFGEVKTKTPLGLEIAQESWKQIVFGKQGI